ncbi:MAG: hypothetical protein INR69_06250 [Mucilaginibacter polytrichastri]|nr:hypothetical protein [Mucilaginibacter polytrichastri]
METTIRLNTDDLNADIIENIKKMFPHKNVEITILPSDETEYIKSNPAFDNELSERIAEYERSGKVVLINQQDLL